VNAKTYTNIKHDSYQLIIFKTFKEDNMSKDKVDDSPKMQKKVREKARRKNKKTALGIVYLYICQ